MKNLLGAKKEIKSLGFQWKGAVFKEKTPVLRLKYQTLVLRYRRVEVFGGGEGLLWSYFIIVVKLVS